MPLYRFKCQRNHEIEALRPMSVDQVHCACGLPALRQGAYRVATLTPTVDMRGKFRLFQEASAEIDHAASAVEASTGQTVATPNIWHAAKESAKQMQQRGEAPPLRAQE